MRLVSLAAALALAPASFAQTHSLLLSPDGDQATLANGNGLVEVGLLRGDEIGIFTPAASASAQAFLPVGAQWAFVGDADADGAYVEDATAGPGGRIDAILVKPGTPAPGPRDAYVSKADEGGGLAPTVEDGDVFRLAGPDGALEFFVREDQILAAIGSGADDDVDVDAIAMSADGALFLSFAEDESVNGRPTTAAACVHVPAAAVGYDASGNVASIAAGSAIVAFEGEHLAAMALASGMRTGSGGPPAAAAGANLTALEVDPGGGEFESPIVPGLLLPNLWFAWSGPSNDGAVLTTAQRGAIATLDGHPLASDVATTGTQVGWLPGAGGVSALGSIALAPATEAPLVCESYPVNSIASQPAWHRVEVSGAKPGAEVWVFADAGPNFPGGALTLAALPTYGDLYVGLSGGGVVLGIVTADAQGYASVPVVWNDPLLPGANLVFQALDASALRLSAPAALEFLP